MSEHNVGICGDRSAALVMPTGETLQSLCRLPAGHAGWHHSDDGSDWAHSDPTELSEECGATVEKLRRENPMNGDGSNYMLDQVIAALMPILGPGFTAGVSAEHQRARDHREAEYRRLEEMNARFRRDPQ